MEQEQQKEKEPFSLKKSVMLYLHDWIYMLAVIMIVLVLMLRLVIVSGPSMYDTLWDGDWVLVLSNVFYRDVEPGDVIVASQDTYNDGEPIIKRVIALEGQTVDIDFEAGIVYVDGTALEEDYTYTPTNLEEGMEFPLTVSEGCIFVMGDNRNRSKDSRNPEIGLIDRREILGKALFLIYPGTHEGVHQRDLSRIGVIK